MTFIEQLIAEIDEIIKDREKVGMKTGSFTLIKDRAFPYIQYEKDERHRNKVRWYNAGIKAVKENKIEENKPTKE